MSKMKHLLRKLHIGGDSPPHHHRPRPDPLTPPPPPQQASATAPEDEGSSSAAADFDFFEEEFQVQLALAISASDPGSGGDAETAQIKAAKQISLGREPDETLVDSLSLRYWSYNFVNYDEKVLDGFYDVYGPPLNPSVQGKMPLLLDLQAITVSDNVDYEVILVNRVTDPALCQLEDIVYAAFLEQQCLEQGQTINFLIQKIANVVVSRMGGPVCNADEMLKKWTLRSYELRSSMNSIILPLGCLDVGLSRHRALLFKVLSDRINLPCMLIKGSYYTGTDEGAVNLIKFDNGSEFIIDLMGAPGELIPAELSSDSLQQSELNRRNSADYKETIKDRQVVNAGDSSSTEASIFGVQSKNKAKDLGHANQTAKFETDFGSIFPSLSRSNEGSSVTNRKASDAHKLKVDDVSKYVISASKNPEFAHKLHAVLLDNSSSPSPDFLLDVNVGVAISNNEHLEFCSKRATDEGFMPIKYENYRPNQCDVAGFGHVSVDTSLVDINEEPKLHNTEGPYEDKKGKVLDSIERENNLVIGVTEICNKDLATCSDHGQKMVSPLLGDASSWEISWEELQLGERIGIGSFGEVYRAEWNATEVAVKKFMDQDISGDALYQFKCEVEIMLRLRHPNLVLFMGAVTRPPNLSILTEYLPRGSLFKLLHRPNNHLDEKRRLRMAVDVAKGMNYLHTSHPTIVHRDLKTPNLLVDKNWNVKVCDFGMSRLKHHTFLSSKSTAGTPEWMAPEVLRNEPSNEKSDVYSFGVILWELATLRVPWSGMNSMQVVGAVGFQKRHLDITAEIDPTAAEIILHCWHPNPQLRPSFRELLSRLRCLERLQCPLVN